MPHGARDEDAEHSLTTSHLIPQENVRYVTCRKCYFVPEVRKYQVPYTTCQMIPEQHTRLITQRYCKMIPECRVQSIPYTTCRMTTEERCEFVKCRRCKLVQEEHVRKIPYLACKMVPVNAAGPYKECCMQPYCVTKKIMSQGADLRTLLPALLSAGL